MNDRLMSPGLLGVMILALYAMVPPTAPRLAVAHPDRTALRRRIKLLTNVVLAALATNVLFQSLASNAAPAQMAPTATSLVHASWVVPAGQGVVVAGQFAGPLELFTALYPVIDTPTRSYFCPVQCQVGEQVIVQADVAHGRANYALFLSNDVSDVVALHAAGVGTAPVRTLEGFTLYRLRIRTR
jgi:hypothetical protein